MRIISLERKQQKSSPLLFLFTMILIFVFILQAVPSIHLNRAEVPPEHTEQSNSSGKNGKHANQDAKNAAKEKHRQVKKEYDELNQKANKTKADKERLQKLRRQVKHWKRKADFNGTNHSQNPKGN